MDETPDESALVSSFIGRVTVEPIRNGDLTAHSPDQALSVSVAARSESDRTAAIPLALVEPELTTEKAQALGIRRQLVSYTT